MATSFVLAALFLLWAPDVYDRSIYIGSLLIFGAILLLSSAVFLVAKGTGRVRSARNFAWGMAGTTMLAYIVILCVAREFGLVGYRGPWHWWDGVGIGLAVLYLLAYGVELRRGGGEAEPPAYPVADYESVWHAQQGTAGGVTATYHAAGERVGEGRVPGHGWEGTPPGPGRAGAPERGREGAPERGR